MASNLLIVESPAKAHTIEKYLGSDYQVVASMGHIRDLPTSKMGVDTEAQFTPQYVIPLKARPNLKKLKDAIKQKTTIYLATDLDREGEAIAWHLQEVLELNPAKQQVKRITFDEISPTALKQALASPRDLNLQLVDAQQARRVLDRLVGYTLSPILWRKLYKGLSAGRVQSVALRLVVEREEERDQFEPQEHWSIEALLRAQAGSPFRAKLVKFKSEKIEQLTIKTAQSAQEIVDSLTAATYTVQKIELKPQTRRPGAPYTTASFQQDVVNKLGMSAKNGMRAAQKLYEEGLITYMRTDSVSLSSEAVAQIRAVIQDQFGATYLPEKPNFYKTKQKQAQEAHEGIRPVNPGLDASKISDAQARKVYDLIWRRAVGSQMNPAQIEQTLVTVSADPAEFRASGQRIVFPGFLALYPKRLESQSDNQEGKEEDQADQSLPALIEGEVLKLEELNPNQHFTEPPPRYSEASLIKALEENGIGRPSTYAPTIDTLIQRNYVLNQDKRLVPEMIGKKVTELLKEHFPSIVDLQFTALMEEELDQIADGAKGYSEVLGEFWKPFIANVEAKSDAIQKVDLTEETSELCPQCNAPMLVKMSRFGKFLACSKFPECKATKSLAVQKETGLICPRDGKTLNWKQSRRGGFMGCSGYPECKFALWKAEQMASKVAELTETEELPYKEPALKLAEEQVKQNPSPETKTQYRARSKSASPVKSKPKAKSVSKAKA